MEPVIRPYTPPASLPSFFTDTESPFCLDMWSSKTVEDLRPTTAARFDRVHVHAGEQGGTHDPEGACVY